MKIKRIAARHRHSHSNCHSLDLDQHSETSDHMADFIHIPLDTPIEQEAAVIALQMIKSMRWYKRLVRGGRIRDEDVLDLVGLQTSSDFVNNLTAKCLKDALDKQFKYLKTKTERAIDPLDKNIASLGQALDLNTTERKVMRLAAVVSRQSGFTDLFTAVRPNERELMQAIHHAVGAPLKEVMRALARTSTLQRSGFFESKDLRMGVCDNPLAMDDDIVWSLYSLSFEASHILRRLLRRAPKPSLSAMDFEHLAQTGIIRQYIKESIAAGRPGVNVLIYGPPGTGKTEYVRHLAADLGLELSEVPSEDRDGDPISGARRFGAYSVCQQLLAKRTSQLLLFDEVEDVFGSGGGLAALFGMRSVCADGLRKSWINDTLESNPTPSIWVCNSVSGMEPAFVRRFDIVTEFHLPGGRVRRRLLSRYFGNDLISEQCAARLAAIEALSPAQIERTAGVIRTMQSSSVIDRDQQAEQLVRGALRATGASPAITHPVLPDHYDPALLNTSQDIEELAAGLARTGQGRICLYGPSGTGKSALACYLGERLDRPVHVKRGSDLLDMFVGGTEAKIANAFNQARDEQAILLVDEADGFLRDRAGATQQWEVTQVNELLTQMEAFDGIFIASTNLMQSLDAASLRRFDFKIRFDYLTPQQCRALLTAGCTDADSETCSLAANKLDDIRYLTPGDFANALRQLQVTGKPATADRIVALLAAETALKPEAKHRSIGFVAAL